MTNDMMSFRALVEAVRRGLQNMRIQAFLTAAVVNLKRLAVALANLFWSMLKLLHGLECPLEPSCG